MSFKELLAQAIVRGKSAGKANSLETQGGVEVTT